MKKSLIALAVLGSMASVAAAQSSVTLFGIVDVNARYVKGGGQNMKLLGTSGNATSRWGLRGTEDLGGGLKAGFWLESALNPDNGTIDATRAWHRRASVSLSGDFGELRLGRYLVNDFTVWADFDPFATTGVGDAGKFHHALGSGVSNMTRADNIVGYFLPSNLGGLYGSFEVAAGEGVNGNKYVGGRLGYAAGPLNVTAGYSTSEVAVNDYKRTSFAGSYDLGVAKLLGSYTQNKYGVGDRKQTVVLIGATIPLGSGHIRTSFITANSNRNAEGFSAAVPGVKGDSKQFAIGYVHDLSKRTAVYATVSRVTNDTNGRGLVVAPVRVVGMPAIGADNGGIDVGIRHSF